MTEDSADGAREQDRGHEPEAPTAIGAFEYVDVEPTTNHYVHARREAAEAVLSGHRLGHQRVGRLGPPSSGVAQLPKTKRCGREDSCVTGIRRAGVDAVHGAVGFQVQYGGPAGAEYTAGERPV